MLKRLKSYTFLALLSLGTVITNPVQAQQATTYQINRAHTGATAFTTAPTFPLAKLWSVSLPDRLSYPVIAEGRVFVLSRSINGGYGTKLYALDSRTGKTLWLKAISGSYFWAAHTYGDGRLYVVNGDGRLQAFNPATGVQLWSRQMPGQYSFDAAPTFSKGMIYVSGSGSGGTLYAVRASDGSVIWSQSVANGDQSSPSVSDNAVFVSYACNQAYSFGPLTGRLAGKLIWHHTSGCSGGGGKTTVLSQYGLFTRDSLGNLILNPQSGKRTGTFKADVIPAFASSYRYSLTSGKLIAFNHSSNTQAWSFSGDGTLSSAPIVVNGYVFTGGKSGMLYALNRYSGREVWKENVGAGIDAPDEQNVSQPLTGLAAGEGVIVVPAGNRLITYASPAKVGVKK